MYKLKNIFFIFLCSLLLCKICFSMESLESLESLSMDLFDYENKEKLLEGTLYGQFLALEQENNQNIPYDGPSIEQNTVKQTRNERKQSLNNLYIETIEPIKQICTYMDSEIPHFGNNTQDSVMPPPYYYPQKEFDRATDFIYDPKTNQCIRKTERPVRKAIVINNGKEAVTPQNKKIIQKAFSHVKIKEKKKKPEKITKKTKKNNKFEPYYKKVPGKPTLEKRYMCPFFESCSKRNKKIKGYYAKSKGLMEHLINFHPKEKLTRELVVTRPSKRDQYITKKSDGLFYCTLCPHSKFANALIQHTRNHIIRKHKK